MSSETRVTLEDIARVVGVDKSTVSAALRNAPRADRFRPELRHRILETAERLNYRPNFFASQLASPRRKLILLCLSYLHDSFSAAVAESFEKQAEERGYRIVISVFQDKSEPLSFMQQVVGRQGIDALVVIGSSRKKISDELICGLADEGTKIVLVGREVEHPDIGCILVDNRLGGWMAADHICRQGTSRIWIVMGPYGLPIIEQRVEGMTARLAEAGFPEPVLLSVTPSAEAPLGFSESACGLVRERLRVGEPPEAILTTSDSMAIGIMRALRERGIEPGRDLALVGYDDNWPAEAMVPSLSSVRQPKRRMGRTAADLLIDTLEGNKREERRIIFSPELIVRESSLSASASFYPGNNHGY